MRSPLHIALGDSAGGCVRAACRAHGIPGIALGIPDDLSHGPLDDGRARIDYMRACFRGYDDWYLDITDAFAPWQAMIERLDRNRPEAILILSVDNVSEATFLAMACWWLKGRSEQLLRVMIQEPDASRYVAAHSPDELADLFTSAWAPTDTERANLAEDFLRIRRWEEGRILGVPMDRYAPLLLECCTARWTPAARVVGTAMSRCDGHNLMSDLFFSSRLSLLEQAEIVFA